MISWIFKELQLGSEMRQWNKQFHLAEKENLYFVQRLEVKQSRLHKIFSGSITEDE